MALAGFFAVRAAQAETPIDAAIALYLSKDFAGAEMALRKIVASDPKNAAACYYLGMSVQQRQDARSLDESLPWIEKAVQLDPKNALYVGDYGGTCFMLADRDRSYHFAVTGRDSMIKAIALNPDNLPARDGLMQFYARAPWPLGSTSKAFFQAEEIGIRDANRGARAYLKLEQIFEKKKDLRQAREACKGALNLDPDNAAANEAIRRLGSDQAQPP
jgi:tetratricopeptide (TPR) repeat protein